MLIWPNGDRPNRIAFISDLHLFSSRSTAEQHQMAMQMAASEAEMVVFGGDLFDFRWSQLGGPGATTTAAVDWLSRFMDTAGQRQYVFLFGNHDGDERLRDGLRAWAETRPEFQIAGDLLRVGDIMMLHGDAIEGNGDLQRFDAYRARWALKPQASTAQSRVYDAAVTLRAHRVAAIIAHRRRRTCQRLTHYLAHHACGPEEGIRRVIFGHTHRFLPGHWFGGMRFYNPGAAVRGVPFKPVVLATDEP